MRTLIDLPDDDVASLDRLAQRHGRSRAAEVREAVRAHLRGSVGNDWIARGFGYWRDREDIGDAVDYQRGIRQDRSFD
ncbi:CopG family transcriptional regulator [Sphingomonas sp. AR_OL41]|jgi:predicted transcriptional regulator|uniref:ribbon-helix-helix domain-containing protein n=1 Tax=Sphingomonas sp. AR_OL41 TaxID=3042729 RepID=UPI0024807F68|nr:CopG family transcriptional regulator [Sphingomonas sp. AR_OL41]MDH7973040.1 CopG family transcriptional regulator [Sphingomonas sp. AR_OL41]